MSIDNGGGPRGAGGTLADSTDPTVANFILNRSLVDYNVPIKTTDQANLSPLDLTVVDDGKESDQYFVVSAGVDFLFVNQYVSGEQQDALLQVSIPFTLRRSFWEGKELNGWTYRFTSYGTRIRTFTALGIVIEEHVWPAYQSGEVIIATESNTADENTSLLVDTNDAGRSWIPYSPRIMIVKSVNDDTLTCAAIEDQTETFEVAKPHTLRRSGWDAVPAIQGISYLYGSPASQTRIASQAGEDDEDQLIIPPYIPDQSEIKVDQLNTSLTYGALATSLYDSNNDGRAWAKEPV
jgi:hypothetical protein